MTIPVLASNYNALADFGSDHGSPEKDGAVDFEDLMIFSQAYGSTPSDPNWNPACDICGQSSSDPDGQVDFEDLMPLADSFGEREEKEWTVMFYMAGDDNIWPFGLLDLHEIEKALEKHPINSGKINVVAQYDSLIDELKVTRYHLKPDYLSTTTVDFLLDIVQVLPELNMSSPDNLTNFINWAKDKYSAKRYALVLWGHGGGWRSVSSNRGILTDQNPWQDQKMSIEQLARALNDANQRMDLVICNSYLMQTMEVVYELKSLVSNNLPDYFIASQQSNSGLPWYELTDYLCSDYTASPEDFCLEIIDKYTQSDKCDPEWGTFSAVNMNYLSLNRISYEINKFADALLASQYPDQIEEAKAETQSVNYEPAENYKDLKHFAEKIKEKGVTDCYVQADVIIELVEDLFPSGYENHVTGGSVDHCNGINIELPTSFSDYLSFYKYVKFAEDTHWDEFISRGSSVANVRAKALTTDIDGSIEYKVKISWDEYENAESYTIFRGTVEDVLESIHTTDASTLEYYDNESDPSKTYYYAIIAKGNFGSGETPLSEIKVVNFLPSCSLISPPHDPNGNQPITDTNPEFRWESIGINLPYGVIDDIESVIEVYDLTAADKRVWIEIIKDFTIDNVIYGDDPEWPGLQNDATPLEDGHEYRWYVEFRGYNVDNNVISYSRSQEWEFTYGEASSGPVHNLTQHTYYTTIQTALDDANSGDTIEVADGIYDESITFPSSKNITLQSVNGPAYTIIKGNNGSCTITSGSSTEVILTGFTITHISGQTGWGIGNYNNSNMTINNCTISNNIANTTDGGGIRNGYDSTLTITGSTISGNSATVSCSGGIINSGNMTIIDCSICNNYALNGAGGISNIRTGNLTITGSTISDNTAAGKTVTYGGQHWDGGGIGNWEGTLTITGSTISNNTAANGNGGGISNNVGTLTITGSTISSNSVSINGGGIFFEGDSTSVNIGGSSSLDIDNFNTFTNNYKKGYAPSPDQHIWDSDTGDCHIDYPYNEYDPN